MKHLSVLFFLVLSSVSLARTAVPPLFYAQFSAQAILNFDFYVEIESPTQPTEKKALTQINKQVAFLFGTLDNQAKRAVPKRNHRIKILEISELESMKWKVSYEYTGTIQTAATTKSISFDLPLNPDRVYNKSLLVTDLKTYHPCGDETHPQEKYFWYFFNPHGYSCPLEKDIDYKQLKGSLEYFENTKDTFPEYERLTQDGVISVDFFYGMDNPSLTHNPLKSKDYNADNYRQMRDYLIGQQYEYLILGDGTLDTLYKEQFTKSTPAGLIKVTMFFGGTDTYSGQYFRQEWIKSLSQNSVVIYAGHSGLGSYLDIKEIEAYSGLKLNMANDRYQILFMNGCSSYPYYGDPYFDLKKSEVDPNGTKNLDIITNGLSTYFSAIAPSNQAVFNAIEKWALTNEKTSYQKIIEEADSFNLIGINGDEDNN